MYRASTTGRGAASGAGDGAAAFAAADVLDVGKGTFDEFAVVVADGHLPHFFAGLYKGVARGRIRMGAAMGAAFTGSGSFTRRRRCCGGRRRRLRSPVWLPEAGK